MLVDPSIHRGVWIFRENENVFRESEEIFSWKWRNFREIYEERQCGNLWIFTWNQFGRVISDSFEKSMKYFVKLKNQLFPWNQRDLKSIKYFVKLIYWNYKKVDFTKFFNFGQIFNFWNHSVHNVEKREIFFHQKNISSNQLFSYLFSKTVIITKFLPKMREWEFS